MDWGERMISRTLDFFDPFENKEYVMKDVRIKKRYENDLPIFTVLAQSGDSELMAEMATYGRCCWNITQPFIWPFWLGIFYNEYPARTHTRITGSNSNVRAKVPTTHQKSPTTMNSLTLQMSMNHTQKVTRSAAFAFK